MPESLAFEEWLRRFEMYLRFERRYSGYTVTGYVGDVSSFHAYQNSGERECVDIALTSRECVRGWLADMTRSGLAVPTINRRLEGVRYFFRYLQREGAVQQNPTCGISRLREPRRLPSYLRKDEAERLFENVDYGEGWRGVRDRFLLLLLYSLGLRRSEAAELRWQDFSKGYTSVRVRGKGDKDRVLPLTDELIRLACEYGVAVESAFGGASRRQNASSPHLHAYTPASKTNSHVQATLLWTKYPPHPPTCALQNYGAAHEALCTLKSSRTLNTNAPPDKSY